MAYSRAKSASLAAISLVVLCAVAIHVASLGENKDQATELVASTLAADALSTANNLGSSVTTIKSTLHGASEQLLTSRSNSLQRAEIQEKAAKNQPYSAQAQRNFEQARTKELNAAMQSANQELNTKTGQVKDQDNAQDNAVQLHHSTAQPSPTSVVLNTKSGASQDLLTIAAKEHTEDEHLKEEADSQLSGLHEHGHQWKSWLGEDKFGEHDPDNEKSSSQSIAEAHDANDGKVPLKLLKLAEKLAANQGNLDEFSQSALAQTSAKHARPRASDDKITIKPAHTQQPGSHGLAEKPNDTISKIPEVLLKLEQQATASQDKDTAKARKYREESRKIDLSASEHAKISKTWKTTKKATSDTSGHAATQTGRSIPIGKRAIALMKEAIQEKDHDMQTDMEEEQKDNQAEIHFANARRKSIMHAQTHTHTHTHTPATTPTTAFSHASSSLLEKKPRLSEDKKALAAAEAKVAEIKKELSHAEHTSSLHLAHPEGAETAQTKKKTGNTKGTPVHTLTTIEKTRTYENTVRTVVNTVKNTAKKEGSQGLKMAGKRGAKKETLIQQAISEMNRDKEKGLKEKHTDNAAWHKYHILAMTQRAQEKEEETEKKEAVAKIAQRKARAVALEDTRKAKIQTDVKNDKLVAEHNKIESEENAVRWDQKHVSFASKARKMQLADQNYPKIPHDETSTHASTAQGSRIATTHKKSSKGQKAMLVWAKALGHDALQHAAKIESSVKAQRERAELERDLAADTAKVTKMDDLDSSAAHITNQAQEEAAKDKLLEQTQISQQVILLPVSKVHTQAKSAKLSEGQSVTGHYPGPL